MSLLRAEKASLRDTRITELKLAVASLKRQGVTWAEFFRYFRPKLGKTEWMILDSVMKGAPIETLDKTLLLRPENFLETLQNLTLAVSELVAKKSIKA